MAFTGDAVLGWGSVFIAPDPGALAGYLDGLAAAGRAAAAAARPGHGPVVTAPAAKLEEYVAHRLERERRLVRRSRRGRGRSTRCSTPPGPRCPTPLRPAAAVTLAAHLDKLDAEGRLPERRAAPRPDPLSAP